MTRPLRFFASMPLACILLSGCHVATHNDGANNVDIKTPFGSMKVKTNSTTDTSAIGLAPYPGAIPVADSSDKDGNAANVNMNFGSFHLGVKTAFFQTPDPQEKVIAFYRKDLATHFGDVIECSGDKTIGTPTRTAQGLTCGDSRSKVNSVLDHLELRAGSEHHQHIVTVEDHEGGTKIGLVSLDLPAHLSAHDNKDSE